MRNFDVKQQYETIKKAAVDAIQEIFPVEGKMRSMRLDRVWVEDKLDSQDYQSQSKMKNKEGTWGSPVFAALSLVDKMTGKTLDKADKVKLFTLPKITDRWSYIVSGNEYQVSNQLRLRPGVYTLRRQNGELKTQINLARGKNFDLAFDESKGKFSIQKVGGGQANIPLYPILVHLGISPSAIAKAWGQRLEMANKNIDAKAVQRAMTAFGIKGDMTLKGYFDGTQISPETTKLVLGVGFEKVDGSLLLAASKNLLEVHLGKQEPVDRDSLAFKELHSVEDFIKERLQKNKGTLAGRIKRTIDNPRRDKVSQIVNPASFNNVIESFFTQDDKASTPEQTNPLEMLSGGYKVTTMGSGGITSEHSVTPEMREIHPSHYGFLDPIATPESGRIGINLNIPLGAIKDGKEIKAILRDKNGKAAALTPTQTFDKYVAFPGQKGDKVQALYRGVTVEIPKSKVDYFTPSASVLFSPSTNLVPFLPSNQGNRAMMASKMLDQAIALKHREAPLVQVEAAPGTSMEQQIGARVAATAPADGKITAVTPDHIKIKTATGTETVNLYNNFTLNRKSFLHHNAVVKVGDTVKKGQLLADSNFTKGGTLALGTNLRTAYLPYKGLNHEDGLVITESAAEKLTSEHIHKKTLPVDEQTVLNLVAFRSFYPNLLNPENVSKLDSDGIIKKGAKIKMGEALVAALKKRVPSKQLAVVHKALSDRPRDASVYWTMEDDGTIQDIQRVGGKVIIYVKTEERAKIGDKLAGRVANKGIITKIIPDSHAPKDADGNPVDILMNPHGVISRINIGQIYESAMGKAALKSGKPINVGNFTGENYLSSTKKVLKAHGISDKEELFDPETGKSLGRVHVGNPYILKLFKQSTGNFSVRQGGPGQPYDLNQQPLKAGGEEAAKSLDLLTMYSMLSHGARANLREMSAIKGNQNDEFWKALKSGQQLPPPKSPFVYDKFIGYLKGAGIDVKKDGTKLTLAPLTDKQVEEMSGIEIKKPLFFRAKDMEPIKGGFFDPIRLGGYKGNKWGHIALAEPVINPVFEDAAQKLLGIGPKFKDIMAGKLHVDKDGKLNTEGRGVTSGQAIEQLLKKIDVNMQSKLLMEKVKKAKGNDLDRINKQLRYLEALKTTGLRPEEAYIRKSMPVVPAMYRPVFPLPNGSIQTSDVNMLYQNVGILNMMMQKPVMNLLPEDEKAAIRNDLYEHVKGVSGLTDISIKGKGREGFITQIKGGLDGQPKSGFFISKMLSKKQDFVGRGTIIPEPDLGIDEMAMPEEMAWKMFEPFIIRELKNHGKTPLAAKDEIKQKTPLAKKALEIVMKDRHVLLNRAPSLHKFSIMAFKPTITQGRAIKIPPLVLRGFAGDFDGDEQVGMTLTLVDNVGMRAMEEIFPPNFIENRIMTARFKAKLPAMTDGGEIMLFNLEDFPHGELIGSKEGEKGRIDFFKALPGFHALAHDHKTNTLAWKPIFGWSKHYQREIEVVTLSSGFQIITDDDPRAVYGMAKGTLEMQRFTPSEAKAKHVFVPRTTRITHTDISSKETVSNGEITVPLNREFGYFLGAMVSNGWAEHHKGELTGRMVVAMSDAGASEAYKKSVAAIIDGKGTYSSERAAPEEGDSHYGAAKKINFGCKPLAKLVKDLIGVGAHNKHLPPCFLASPTEFKEGLLAGLMDNDGSIAQNKSGKRSHPQLLVNYSSVSLRLVQEMQLLAASLGIKSRVTPSKTPAGAPFWYLGFSSIDFKKWGGKGMHHTTKVAALESGIVDEFSSTAAACDVVPIPENICSALRKILGAPRNSSKEHMNVYHSLSKSLVNGSISRFSAKRLFDFLDFKEASEKVHDLAKWWSIVSNEGITWDYVDTVEKTGIREDGYDLTVPGYETFMNVDGVILSNTMSVHTSVTDEANKEAEKMLPSRNLFQPGTGDLMIVPSQEAQIGLFYLSQDPAKRSRINKLLPPKYAISGTLAKKDTKALLTRIAKELPAGEYAKIVTELRKEGEKYALERGFTLGVDDLAQFTKARDKLMVNVDKRAKKAKTQAELATLNAATTKVVDAMIEKKLKGTNNPLYDMVESGARGDRSQLRSILATPLFMSDARGKIVASPIKKSYAEGLSIADYWTSMYGARRGMMDRAIQTSLPGAFSKDVMAITLDNVVSDADCGTKEGIFLRLESQDALNRFLAGDQAGFNHNTLVDTKLVAELKKKGQSQIKVRSPLRCLKAKGTCAKCYGLDEHGQAPEVGENIGAKAGQTISEPLTQMIMRCSDGHIIAEDGKAYAFIDYYENLDVEAVWDGHCWAKTTGTENRVSDCGKLVHSPIIQTHEPHDRMLFFKTKTGHTLLTQGNHPLWVYDAEGNAQEKLAEDVEKGDRLKIDTSMLSGEEKAPFNPYFIGRYLADGSTRYGNGTKKYAGVPVATIVTGQDIAVKDKTQASVAELDARKYPKDVQVYRPEFAADFVERGVRGRYAHKKRLAPGFNLWSQNDLAQVLAGYIDGDSTVHIVNGTTVAQIYTASYLILQQIEMICSKLNIRFTPQVVCERDCQKNPQFSAQLRFNDRSVYEHSIKMQRVEFLVGKYCIKHEEFEPITYIKEMWKWDLPVWDIKTETLGFTCGMVRNHNTFHTGGVAGTGASAQGFDRVSQLLKLPKIVSGAATLAPTDGRVMKITKGLAGGHEVTVEKTTVHVPRGLTLKVKVGAQVKAGDALSEGVIKPQDLVKHKGMLAAQEYITDELKNAYGAQGIGIERKMFETVVRSLGNTTQVLNNPKDSTFLPGDVVPYTVAENYNKNLIVTVPVEQAVGFKLAEPVSGLKVGAIIGEKDVKILKAKMKDVKVEKDAIKHAPFLKGMSALPLLRKDWMAALGYQQLAKTLVEGAGQGWSTDLSSYHPVPAFAFGADFGKGKEGKY